MDFSRSLAEQLAFGSPFDPTPRDAPVASALAAGTLELAPHKAWKMPKVITWRENPFGEVNWVAQFHMLRWIDPLRRRAQAGHERYIDSWLSIAESWIQHNPPGKGRATYSWADMVEAGRALTLCFGLPAVQDLRPSRVDTILESLREHGEWLADPGHIRRGNHALQQHQGLLVIGAVLERPDWVRVAIGRATQMLRDSYDEQGMNEEGAIQYHQINFMWWRTLRKRIEVIEGASPDEFDRIRLAPVGMAHATRPDGLYELIGDTEEFRPRNLGHPAIEYVSSGGTLGTPPAERVKVYESGYVFGRSSWGAETERESFSESTFYSLRFGPQNRIHGHADGMALTLYSDGGPLLVDSGKYAYDAKDPYRAHLLAREAHNSISVAGYDYDKASTVELTHYQLGGCLEHFRFRDQGYRGVVLTRDVLVSRPWGLIFVLDWFKAETDITVSQWWHLPPAASHRVEGDSIFVRCPQNSLRFAWREDAGRELKVRKGTKTPIQGWFSPSWRKLVPVRVVEAAVRGVSGAIPTALSIQRAVESLSVEEFPAPADEQRVFRVRRGGGEVFEAVVGPEGATLDRIAFNPPEAAP